MSRFRSWTRVLVLIGMFVVTPRLALAHPEVLRIEPPADARLPLAPPQVRVVFNESIEGAFSSIQLFDAQQRQVDTGGGGRSPHDPTVLELPLPPLDPGVYTMVWHVVGSDGHPVKGNSAFTVLGSGSTATVAPTTERAPVVDAAATATVLVAPVPTETGVDSAFESAVPLSAALLRALVLLGALGCVGSWLFLRFVLAPTMVSVPLSVAGGVLNRWRASAWWSVLLLLGATPLLLAQHTLAVAGVLNWSNISTVVSQTRFGQGLTLRILFTLGLVITLILGRRQPRIAYWQSILALVLGSGVLLTFSLSGHAAAQAQPLLAVLADWLHLVATALWVGGLWQLARMLPLLVRELPVDTRGSALAGMVERFSRVVLVSVLVLTASGTYTALLHLSRLSDLILSDYGRALLVKLVLFAGLLVFGAYHLLVMRPRFVTWATHVAERTTLLQWYQRFQWTLRGEVVLALLVIVAVGFLTSLAPPPPVTPVQAAINEVPAQHAPVPLSPTLLPTIAPPTRTPVPSKPFDQTQQAGDTQVRLEVAPASLDENRFRVTVTDSAGAPVTVQLVRLQFEMTTMDMGTTQLDATAQDAGLSIAQGSPLSMVGNWRVRVLVRRIDADDVEATFIVPVGE